MKSSQSVLLVLSLVLNAVFVLIWQLYLWTPIFDYPVVVRSLERICTLDVETPSPICDNAPR